jgi:hypothetical protein
MQTVFKKGEYERVVKGVNLIKVHYMHVWEYHNDMPLYN